MDLLRRYIWVLVIVGVIFVSTVIVLIFLIINRCISRRGKFRMSQLQRRSDNKTESNKYQERNLDTKTPPLPPRTQFLTAEAQSYENLAEGSDGEHSVADYEQIDDGQCEYVKVEEETEMLPPPPCYAGQNSNLKSGDSVGQSYENLAEDHDYEQSTDQHPDYISVADETEILPPPIQCNAVPNLDHCVSLGQSYENLAEDHDYEQSTDQHPDYISVADETEILPPPIQCNAVPNLDHCVSLGQSYENLAEDHDYEQSTDQQPDYLNGVDETEILPPPIQCNAVPNLDRCVSMGQSYEDLAEDHDYEQSLDEQPDYVKAEDEETKADNTSTEDYDDIECEEDEDDYDDVV
ncbi:protein clarinet-like [Melanotaenia boesemani]|uniref:protein clarinet-like n=1 Tax=Melanotaenia boesemani TaxID=1250792 RepID=UPI001C04B899|nr:protein clarinet-like [Melanotaenia boesemani]